MRRSASCPRAAPVDHNDDGPTVRVRPGTTPYGAAAVANSHTTGE